MPHFVRRLVVERSYKKSSIFCCCVKRRVILKMPTTENSIISARAHSAICTLDCGESPLPFRFFHLLLYCQMFIDVKMLVYFAYYNSSRQFLNKINRTHVSFLFCFSFLCATRVFFDVCCRDTRARPIETTRLMFDETTRCTLCCLENFGDDGERLAERAVQRSFMRRSRPQIGAPPLCEPNS